MWRELIAGLTPQCTFNALATPEQLAHIEAVLGITPPNELTSLLAESNGVTGQYGLGIVWPVEQIVETNRAFRSDPDLAELYMPFNSLLFFADAGNGDQFAFSITAAGTIHRPDVFVWDHENDSRTWIAPSLRLYLEWWLSGRITI